jgi:hypothetical protein
MHPRAEPKERVGPEERKAADRVVGDLPAPQTAVFAERSARPYKPPYKSDLLWETLRPLDRPGRARTVRSKRRCLAFAAQSGSSASTCANSKAWLCASVSATMPGAACVVERGRVSLLAAFLDTCHTAPLISTGHPLIYYQHSCRDSTPAPARRPWRRRAGTCSRT